MQPAFASKYKFTVLFLFRSYKILIIFFTKCTKKIKNCYNHCKHKENFNEILYENVQSATLYFWRPMRKGNGHHHHPSTILGCNLSFHQGAQGLVFQEWLWISFARSYYHLITTTQKGDDCRKWTWPAGIDSISCPLKHGTRHNFNYWRHI